MKKSLHILTLAVVSLAAIVSCSKNFEWNDNLPDGQESITLRFASSAMTKADVDGVERENYVGSLQFFVFAANADGTVDDTAEYVLSDTYAADGTGWSHSASTDAAAEKWVYSLTKAQIAQLFPVGTTKVKVFAVANYSVPAEKKTWKDLNEIEVGATFTKDGGPGYGLRWPRAMQPDDENLYFVMTGTADVELGDTEAKVMLARLASKVTVSFEYEEVTDSQGVVWKPQPTGKETRVYLSNAICTTTLGGPLNRPLNPDGGSESAPDPDRDVFEYAYDYMKDVPVVDGKQTALYYTYPIQMEVGDDNQPYIKLVMMWYGYKTIDGVETYYKAKEVYYKIALPSESICEPNHIYEYNVKVNIIGSDKEVLLTPDYIVKDWTTRDPIAANVATGRYISLEIPKDEYDMFVDNININFVSSGTVVPIINEIYQWNYSSSTATRDYFMQNNAVTASSDLMTRKGVTADQIKGWVTIPEESSYLRIDHELCNDITVTPISKFDAAPYVYDVTLHLVEAEDDSFDRHVIITQYPAMYIVAETNSAYGSSNQYGYVYVNGQQNTTQNNWYLVSGLSGNNSNPNMFVITSTILTDPNMILADPRTTAVQNTYNGGTDTWSPSIPSMYESGNRKLTYYYPTDNSTAAAKKVSPKFRVASSYGKTYPLNRQGAFQRCASYQEDGYPAGRWRIPTAAEVEYVVNLSANGFMDVLFGNPRTENENTNYWTASGYITVNNYTETVTPHTGDPSSGNVYVRCVYDDWYWSDKAADKSSPIWGDKQR